MALFPDGYWLKRAGRERSRETWESSKIMGVRKSEEVAFEARKNLITRKRECSARVGRSRADDCGMCQEQMISDLLVESSISEERSCRMIDQQT